MNKWFYVAIFFGVLTVACIISAGCFLDFGGHIGLAVSLMVLVPIFGFITFGSFVNAMDNL